MPKRIMPIIARPIVRRFAFSGIFADREERLIGFLFFVWKLVGPFVLSVFWLFLNVRCIAGLFPY